MRPEGLGKFKNSPYRVLNSRPFGLQHSALTITLPHALIITDACTKSLIEKQGSSLSLHWQHRMLDLSWKWLSDLRQIKWCSQCKRQNIACSFTDVQTVAVPPLKDDILASDRMQLRIISTWLKSKPHYDWRSVSQYVLVSSPIWDFWPDFLFISKLLSCLFGAPSLMTGRVCHLSVFVIAVYNSQSLFTTNIYIKIKIYIVLHTFTIYTGLIQSRLCTADYALLTISLLYHGSLRHLNSRTHDRRSTWLWGLGPIYWPLNLRTLRYASLQYHSSSENEFQGP
jgi:hypothetical protein